MEVKNNNSEAIEHKLDVSVSPHIKDKATVQKVMLDVIIALIPAGFSGIYFFGIRSIYVILTCVIMSVISEWIMQIIMGVEVTVDDLSAVVTGILLAYCLPPSVPLWVAGIGAVTAIALVKNLFGGLGYNIFNPALAARAILVASWPVAMTLYIAPKMGSISLLDGIDGITSATPLTLIKESYNYLADTTNLDPEKIVQMKRNILDLGNKDLWLNLFTGVKGGSLGETSNLALLSGGCYLLIKKIIDWRVPVTFIGTVLIFSLVLGRNPVFNILSGGLFLGAFFMATDYVTSPVTPVGRLIFGVCCGLFVVLIRFYGGYPEGVCYSILIMNMLVPAIDKFTIPKTFGY
ncbi:MAG: RnfABCDGE type electron transport complex subunit D [bacterium]